MGSEKVGAWQARQQIAQDESDFLAGGEGMGGAAHGVSSVKIRGRGSYATDFRRMPWGKFSRIFTLSSQFLSESLFLLMFVGFAVCHGREGGAADDCTDRGSGLARAYSALVKFMKRPGQVQVGEKNQSLLN